VTGLVSGKVNVFSSTLTKTDTFTAHTASITKVIYVNGYILTASLDTFVKIWDPSDWSLAGTYTGHTVDIVALKALSNTVILSGDNGGDVRQWTLASGSFSTTSVVYSSAGTCCGGATFSYSVVMDACYIPYLNKIVVALSNGKIQMYTKDASAITGQLSSYWSGSQFYGHSGGSGINALALVDDTNGYMASGGADNRVIIWDVPNSLVKYRLTGHADQAYGLKFWSASNYLASGSGDGTVRLWDTTTGTFVRSFATSYAVIDGFGFLSSSTLVIGAFDTTIKTFDVTTANTVLTSNADDGIKSLAMITSEI